MVATLGLPLIVSNGVAGITNDSTFDRFVSLAKFEGRLAYQPAGPFLVVVFHEDALGDHIGVMYWGAMGQPAQGKWALADRFWQAAEWSADVTAIAWGPSAKFLYVATGGTYGTGSLYRLDLLSRSAQLVFPSRGDLERAKGQEISSTIVSVDASRETLTATFESSGLPKPLVKEIPFE